MIDYSMKALSAEELSFEVNRIQATPETRFAIKPVFSRRIRQANENPEINFVTLECSIKSTEEEPKPFNITVRMAGVFEVKNMKTDEDKRFFALNATETMFPFVRAAVANLTAAALMSRARRSSPRTEAARSTRSTSIPRSSTEKKEAETIRLPFFVRAARRPFFARASARVFFIARFSVRRDGRKRRVPYPTFPPAPPAR